MGCLISTFNRKNLNDVPIETIHYTESMIDSGYLRPEYKYPLRSKYNRYWYKFNKSFCQQQVTSSDYELFVYSGKVVHQ